MPAETKLPSHMIVYARLYLIMCAGMAFAAGMGSLSRYTGGPRSTQVLHYIGTICGTMLVLAALIEVIMMKYSERRWIKAANACMKPLLGKFNVADCGLHVAVQVLSIASTGLVAVNMHNDVWDWQMSFMFTLMCMGFIYNMVYTPAILASVAMYGTGHTENYITLDKVVLAHYNSTAYFGWKYSAYKPEAAPVL